MMIVIQNITKHYGNLKVLDAINLKIDKREIFGIIGQSGAGKSTLLKLINKLEDYDSGTLSVNGQSLDRISERSLQSLRFETGMIFQNFNLLDHLTVYENIELPLKLQGKSNQAKIEELLSFVTMSDKRDAYPHTLSGGQMQRVAIARALVSDPSVLLCDEATSALDSVSSQEVIELLKRANKTFKTTIVIVTHDLNVAKQLCDRVAVLEDGSITDIITVNKSDISNVDNFKERAREVLSL